MHTFSVVSPAAITICFSCTSCMFWETVPLPRPLAREGSSVNLILHCCVTSISPISHTSIPWTHWISFLDLSAMCPFRRSLTTLSLRIHIRRLWRKPGDRRLHTPEIGERQLSDWRLHRLPDVPPFCQPGVPFNTPILSLVATSSLPVTWSVQSKLTSSNYLRCLTI